MIFCSFFGATQLDVALIPLVEEATKSGTLKTLGHWTHEMIFQVSFCYFTAGVVENISVFSVVGRIILTINHHLVRPEQFFHWGGLSHPPPLQHPMPETNHVPPESLLTLRPWKNTIPRGKSTKKPSIFQGPLWNFGGGKKTRGEMGSN